MDTTFNILVIVLSSLLAIFLIMAIAVIFIVLKLVNSLRQVVAKGEHLVDNAEDLTHVLRKNANAVALLKLAVKFASKVK